MKGLRNSKRGPKIVPTPEVTGWELPDIEKWRLYFPIEKVASRRANIRNPDTAQMLAEAFVPSGSRDKIIIDVLPGPGQLTRALLKLPKCRIKKIIVLEPANTFMPYLKSLETLDPRVTVYQYHGKEWDTYRKLKELGAFDDIVTTDWNDGSSIVHPQLQFLMHMHSSIEGEQLLSQLLRCVPERQWFFQYGRVPLNIILPAPVWERVLAKESTPIRCKLGVIAQATMEIQNAVDPRKLQPFEHHFHPKPMLNFADAALKKGAIPHVALTMTPWKDSPIEQGDMDIWDYVIRRLFVQKATPVKKCLESNSLGPGAANMIPKLTDSSLPEDSILDLTKIPRNLAVHDWKLIVDAFKKWPFRPSELGINTFTERPNNLNR
ncbi:S-adenosyl-L-methionine-dependent methyltransferase [Crepidotus variabilis]|uniref:rRNA adenine N(6)-methyltransferase n=1 Tax=Crepidotus variabilis TaxID=179855 RepID=A0A9P6E541_9AGAR|nr:S-adenosyl-L-methionine-dependent methyltransferase [Crepidotus variabilis]